MVYHQKRAGKGWGGGGGALITCKDIVSLVGQQYILIEHSLCPVNLTACFSCYES